MVLIDVCECRTGKFYFREHSVLLCTHVGKQMRFVDRRGKTHWQSTGKVISLAINDWPDLATEQALAIPEETVDDGTVVETSADPIGDPTGSAYRTFENRDEFMPFIYRTIHAPRFFEDFYLTIDCVNPMGVIAFGQFIDWVTLLRECVFADTGEPVGMPLVRSYDGPIHNASCELATA